MLIYFSTSYEQEQQIYKWYNFLVWKVLKFSLIQRASLHSSQKVRTWLEQPRGSHLRCFCLVVGQWLRPVNWLLLCTTTFVFEKLEPGTISSTWRFDWTIDLMKAKRDWSASWLISRKMFQAAPIKMPSVFVKWGYHHIFPLIFVRYVPTAESRRSTPPIALIYILIRFGLATGIRFFHSLKLVQPYLKCKGRCYSVVNNVVTTLLSFHRTEWSPTTSSYA